MVYAGGPEGSAGDRMHNTEVFSLHLADAPDTLQRVLAVCHRKQCDVVGVSFHCGDRHRHARLELSVRAGARAPELASRLASLVDVLDVSRAVAGARGATGPSGT